MTSKSKLPVGTLLTFTGYTDLGDNAPLLKDGETVEVMGHGENGAVQVRSVADETKADTLFPDEFTEFTAVVEKPLAGVTFDPEASIADLRKVAADNGQKATGRSKPEVIASLEEMGAEAAAEAVEVEVEPEVEETILEEAPAEEPVAATPIRATIAVPENRDVAPAIVDSARVQELLDAQDALAAAKALAQQAEEAFFSLGGVLSHVHEEELYKTIKDEEGKEPYAGKNGFAEYAFNELNVNYRKAMNLIAIYRKFRELDLDETQAIRIGWTKLREIIGVLNEENAQTELEYASTHTRQEIVEHVTTTYVSATDEKAKRVKKTRLTFDLFEQNTEVVQNALDMAKELGGVSTPEQALVLICAEWGQLTGNIEVSLPDQIAALEARYGVQLGVREGADRDAEVDLETEAAE